MPLNTPEKEVLRKHLIESLSGRKSHLTFEQAVKDFPEAFINQKVDGVPHSAWDLVEHLRIAQFDILDFIKNPDYEEMPWPEGYWPKTEGSVAMWKGSIKKFLGDRDELVSMINDDAIDLFSPIPHVPDYTIFREIIIMANHNSYHTGQLIFLRRAFDL